MIRHLTDLAPGIDRTGTTDVSETLRAVVGELAPDDGLEFPFSGGESNGR